MADQLQLRGGTTAEHATFTGALREVTVDTDKDTLVVHDGVTAGGHPLQPEYFSRTGTVVSPTNAGDNIVTTGRIGVGNSNPTASLMVGSNPNGSTLTSGAGALSLARNGDTFLEFWTSGSTQSSKILYNQSGTEVGNIEYKSNTLRFNVNQAERARLSSTGVFTLGDGTTNAVTLDPGSTGSPLVRDSAGRLLVGTASSTSGALLTTQGNSSSSTGAASVFLQRGSANPSGTLGSINFADSNEARGAQISAATDGTWTAGTSSPGQLTFSTTPTGSTAPEVRATIDSAGRLLVGAASTSAVTRALFQGHSTSATSDAKLYLARGQAITAGDNKCGSIEFSDTSHVSCAQITALSDAAWTAGSSTPSRLAFLTTPSGSTTPVERMRIRSSGQVSCSSVDNGIDAFVNATPGVVKRLFRGFHTSSAGSFSGTLAYQVWSNGNVENTNNSYGAISDIKLKENIVDAKSQWDDIKGLRLVNYNFKAETGAETFKQLGLIAQEVEAVCPGLVGETPDLDENGDPTGEVTKNVAYSVLYMKSVGALQEAMARIEALEATNAALEARLAALENA